MHELTHCVSIIYAALVIANRNSTDRAFSPCGLLFPQATLKVDECAFASPTNGTTS